MAQPDLLARPKERQTSADPFAAASVRLQAGRPIRSPVLRRLASKLGVMTPQDAEGELRHYFSARAEDADGLWLHAQTLRRGNRRRDAAGLLERCLQLEPDFILARYNYADLLAQLAEYRAALDQLKFLLAREPHNPLFLNLKATILETIGENEESVAILQELTAGSPFRAESWVSYGHGLRALGRQKESVAAYRKAIRCRPSFGVAWWALANLRTVQFDDADIAAMEAQLKRADISAEDRATLQFSSGKAWEDRKDFARSFELYARANAALRIRINYDPGTLGAGVAATKALFTSRFLESRRDAGCLAPDPIFILGRPRSGSTLVEQILASHSSIEGTAELPYMSELAKRLADEDGNSPPGPKYLAALEALSPDVLRSLGEEYLEHAALHRKLERPFFIDKKPGNFFYLGLILLVLPNAKIIDARRHPAANGLSIFKGYSSKGRLRLTELGQFYRDYLSMMAHFDAVLPGRVHRVIHEQLVADPEREIRRLLDYLGLPFEEACLRFHETKRTVLTPSSEQVRRPITNEAIDYWRHYQPFLGPLLNSLGSAVTSYPDVPEELR